MHGMSQRDTQREVVIAMVVVDSFVRHRWLRRGNRGGVVMVIHHDEPLRTQFAQTFQRPCKLVGKTALRRYFCRRGGTEAGGGDLRVGTIVGIRMQDNDTLAKAFRREQILERCGVPAGPPKFGHEEHAVGSRRLRGLNRRQTCFAIGTDPLTRRVETRVGKNLRDAAPIVDAHLHDVLNQRQPPLQITAHTPMLDFGQQRLDRREEIPVRVARVRWRSARIRPKSTGALALRVHVGPLRGNREQAHIDRFERTLCIDQRLPQIHVR